ncbi:hypothetical protein Pcinc_031456 [Petrolisthes cinctipes]|uniref:Ribosome-recycling factor, mitochondrial n=1 Tax=Petrolisthes cinctipes TaxID=88211 RepID=A0AAE1EX21_PETCI|nr:hypothetical protein Pcinc_031456 [Petrolisthes cinctipes]
MPDTVSVQTVRKMSLLGWRAASRLRPLASYSWSVCRKLSKCYVTVSSSVTSQNFASRDVLFLTPCSFLQCQNRYYAKGKDKKGKNKQTKVHVTEAEMSELVNVTKMNDQFSQLVEDLKQDYIKNLSLRTAAGSLEALPVVLEGDEYPLNEVAQIFRKSPQVVVINAAAFPQALPSIAKAIRESGMNLNPQQEGTSIIVPIPKVTKEHRENLAKSAKTLCNRCKDHLRDAQNQFIRKVKNKEGTVSEDLNHNVQLKIREIADGYVKEAEGLMTAKQKELLQTSK